MFRTILLAGVAGSALLSGSAFAQTDNGTDGTETVVVTARKLEDARAGIQTQIGASTYSITQENIEDTPGGDNSLLNQVILQMPSVAQDSYGQFHIRGEHNALQSVLTASPCPKASACSARRLIRGLASSVELITGALPAEYGLATGGIVDIKPETGLFDPGGTVSVYGGSHNEIEPSFDYGGSSGSLNYFVSGDFTANSLGIELPNGARTPLHDRTEQYHGFVYLEDILDSNSSLTAILGTSHDHFQIPEHAGFDAGLGAHGCQRSVRRWHDLSECLENETQREITHYGIVSYLHSQGDFDFQVSAFGRYSSLNFAPDQIGDLLYNGIAQSAYKQDVALGGQAEACLASGQFAHDPRWHHCRNRSVEKRYDVLRIAGNLLDRVPVDPGSTTNPYSCAPFRVRRPVTTCRTIVDNSGKTQWTESFYLQDEWNILSDLTLNYGLRYDNYTAYSSGDQLSPRVNAVYKPGRHDVPCRLCALFLAAAIRTRGQRNRRQILADGPRTPTAGTSATPRSPRTPRPWPNAPTISTPACNNRS